jgi:hypothetical protein
VKLARLEEARHGDAAPFDEDAAEASNGQRAQDIARRESPVLI